VINMSVTAIVSMAIQLYSITILAYVIMSWVVGASRSEGVLRIYEALGTVCEPYIGIFRRFIPPMGGLDLSPLVALLVLSWVIRPLLVGLLGNLGL
jgi:YggT family protein